MIVQVVKYRAGLSDCGGRLRASPSEPRSTGSCKDYGRGSTSVSPGPASTGDLRVCEDEDSMRGFRESDLTATIPEAYRVEGDPRVEVFEVVSVLCAQRGIAPTS